MQKTDDRELVEELDRELSRKGSLIALMACLAIAAGLAAAAVFSLTPSF